jgi:arsenate reductase (thioredoxin)
MTIEPSERKERTVKYVLFVCTHNAGRSQMAQAFFEKYAPDDVRAESAGQEPADAPWPEVVEAMREVGIDISNRKPKKIDLEMQLHADWAITLNCAAVGPYVPGMVEDWDVEDPRGKPFEKVREIRDDVERRVIDLIENRLDAIRTDTTSHRIRLQRLLPQLIEEFEGSATPRPSAPAPTPLSRNMPMHPSAPSSSRSPTARPATACARARALG